MEELRRAARRQAAPFSRGRRKRNPKRPGRRAGEAYGTHVRRPVPDRVDEEIEAPAPERCPDCGGELEDTGTSVQYQEEIPVMHPRIRRFWIRLARCRRCGAAVRGRSPEQTSDALGAAGVQLGPRALALAAHLNKDLGVPHAKCAQALEAACGLQVSPGALARAMHRLAAKAEPTFAAIAEAVRCSPVVAPDETGWRVAGHKAWLWDFVGSDATLYRVAGSRGFDVAAEVLGEGFSGVLERDGWAPYRRFKQADHQSCVAHLVRRCEGMIADAERGAARVPHALLRILREALGLRDARDAGELSPRTLRRRVAKLAERIETLLASRVTYPPNVRLLRHIATEQDYLFTFLEMEGVEATNWRAEQALRPAVVNRKHWGGNASWRGAHTFEVLASVLRTCRQQGADTLQVLADLLRAPEPTIAQLRLPALASAP